MKTKTFLALCGFVFIIAIPISKIHGQIVYTDIKDTTIIIPPQAFKDTANRYSLDIHNDGNYDYFFEIGNIYRFEYGNLITGISSGVRSFIYPSFNKITGACYANGTYLLNEGDTINKNSNWQDFQFFIFTQSNLPWGCPTVTIGDVFLGLKLVVSSDTLYGWVRCSATDTSITIKDYAYTTIPNSQILAGQTTSGIETNSLNNLIHIYTSCQTLNIDIDGMQSPGTISVINLVGQVLQTFSLSGNHNEIPINSFNQGIYLLKISTSKYDFNETIYLP